VLGKKWKKFLPEGRDNKIEGRDEPSFEDAMLIDMIRSMRKDRMISDDIKKDVK
jgi:hypothetical protein